MRNVMIATVVLTAAVVSGCDTKADQNAQPTVPTIETTPGTTTAHPGGPTELPGSTAPAGAAATTEPRGPSGGPAQCRSADLRLSVGIGDAAAGTIYRLLLFTNAGSTACVLHGFPGVSYVAGDDGHQVGQAATRVGAKGDPVTLAPGETASADIGFTNVHNYDAAVCQPTPVRGLRVYPPQETASVFVPLEATGCAGTPPSPQLSTKAVRRGAS